MQSFHELARHGPGGGRVLPCPRPKDGGGGGPADQPGNGDGVSRWWQHVSKLEDIKANWLLSGFKKSFLH